MRLAAFRPFAAHTYRHPSSAGTFQIRGLPMAFLFKVRTGKLQPRRPSFHPTALPFSSSHQTLTKVRAVAMLSGVGFATFVPGTLGLPEGFAKIMRGSSPHWNSAGGSQTQCGVRVSAHRLPPVLAIPLVAKMVGRFGMMLRYVPEHAPARTQAGLGVPCHGTGR